MPCFAVAAHQKNGDKLIKNRYLCNFTTRLINGRKFISHFEVSRIFNLNPHTVAGLLDGFKTQPGQQDTVVYEKFLRWMDDAAFYELAIRCDLPETEMQTVLAALGHFRQMEAV